MNESGRTGSAARHKFHGCYTATLTPFDGQDRVDGGVVRAHTQWLIENGVAGLCPAGTTGEFLYLSAEESRKIIEETVGAAAGRVPVIAGVWALTAAEASENARAAESAGADAVFLPPPIYYPANDHQVFSWYTAVHKATTLPVFAYNIPQYTANPISVGCLQLLFSTGAIVGVKDSTGDAGRVSELVAQFGMSGVVFAASDGFAVEGRTLGADGFISAIANATPRLFARLWAGEDALQSEVNALRSALKEVGSIAGLKYLMARQGFAFGASRLPFSSLSDAHKNRLDALSL